MYPDLVAPKCKLRTFLMAQMASPSVVENMCSDGASAGNGARPPRALQMHRLHSIITTTRSAYHTSLYPLVRAELLGSKLLRQTVLPDGFADDLRVGAELLCGKLEHHAVLLYGL